MDDCVDCNRERKRESIYIYREKEHIERAEFFLSPNHFFLLLSLRHSRPGSTNSSTVNLTFSSMYICGYCVGSELFWLSFTATVFLYRHTPGNPVWGPAYIQQHGDAVCSNDVSMCAYACCLLLRLVTSCLLLFTFCRRPLLLLLLCLWLPPTPPWLRTSWPYFQTVLFLSKVSKLS